MIPESTRERLVVGAAFGSVFAAAAPNRFDRSIDGRSTAWTEEEVVAGGAEGMPEGREVSRAAICAPMSTTRMPATQRGAFANRRVGSSPSSRRACETDDTIQVLCGSPNFTLKRLFWLHKAITLLTRNCRLMATSSS